MKVSELGIWVGPLFVITGAVLAMVFRWVIVLPAMKPLPDGNYGELFGVVDVFRFVVYISCGLQSFIGLIVCLIFSR
ncbi:MAG: hypothetical protein K8S99_12580 [Planctomycetes bacterium]|nr:hypothetical protein [Planctomycetota bacterium]